MATSENSPRSTPEEGPPTATPSDQPGGPIDAEAPPRPVASYPSYPEAQRAVDLLSDQGFPVERMAIVGHDLELVEQVTGRLTTARAAAWGALQGALLGLLFAALLGVFISVSTALLAVLSYGLVVGAVFGALLGAITHAATGGQRDFSTVGGMRASRYEVLVDADVAEELRDCSARCPSKRGEPQPRCRGATGPVERRWPDRPIPGTEYSHERRASDSVSRVGGERPPHLRGGGAGLARHQRLGLHTR